MKHKVKKHKHKQHKHTSSRTRKSTVTRNHSSSSKTKNKNGETVHNHRTREESERGGKEESRRGGGGATAHRKDQSLDGLRTGAGFTSYVNKAASLMNGDKKKDEMISPLTGMEYVDSNEDYDNKNENQNQKKNSALMIAPGKTATANLPQSSQS